MKKAKKAAAVEAAGRRARMTADQVRNMALPELGTEDADMFRLLMLREIAGQLAEMNERADLLPVAREGLSEMELPGLAALRRAADENGIALMPRAGDVAGGQIVLRENPRGVYGQPANERKPPMSDAEIHAARKKDR